MAMAGKWQSIVISETAIVRKHTKVVRNCHHNNCVCPPSAIAPSNFNGCDTNYHLACTHARTLSTQIRDHGHQPPYVQPDQSCFCFSFHWIATWMERHNSFLTTRLGRLRALGPHMRCAPNGHSWWWTWNVRVVLFGRYWSLSAGTRCLLWTITKRMNTAVLPIWTSSNASAATSKLLIAKLNWINSKTWK